MKIYTIVHNLVGQSIIDSIHDPIQEALGKYLHSARHIDILATTTGLIPSLIWHLDKNLIKELNENH